MTGAIVLLVCYFVHIILMTYSAVYEVIIKKILARAMEIGELKRIAKTEIFRFHQSLKTTAVSIEQLNQVKFDLVNGYVVFHETGIRFKLEPIVCVKLGEEQFAEEDDRALLSRLNFKRAVTKIIIKLQAYKFNL